MYVGVVVVCVCMCVHACMCMHVPARACGVCVCLCVSNEQGLVRVEFLHVCVRAYVRVHVRVCVPICLYLLACGRNLFVSICIYAVSFKLYFPRTTQHSRKLNIMDNMIQMMEQYADHLEEIVSERTLQLQREKKKTDQLLYQMLPKLVLLSLIFTIEYS